jgi:uncharacterized membrane protein
MEETQTLERYPAWIVAVCNLVSLAIYAIGAYVLSRLSPWLIIPYLLYCLWLEIRLLRVHCIDCAYYGKTCGFGKGKLCGLLFKRGDPRRFAAQEVNWTDMLPDLAVSIVPLVGGIVALIVDFGWLILILLLVLLALSTVGNATIRGSLTCKYCRQRTMGCPAERLFGQQQGKRAEEKDSDER